jgi:transposase
MYLAKIRYKYRGEWREYARIVHGYRDNEGKVKIKIIKNLWRIKTPQDWKRAQKFFAKVKKKLEKGKKLVTFEDIKLTTSWNFGLTYMLEEIWKKYKFKEIFKRMNGKNKFDFERMSFLLVANRLSDPGSDLSCFKWIERNWFEGKEKIKIKEEHLYKTLDLLIKKKEDIEKEIFKTLENEIGDIKIVLYDITSTYFESKKETSLKKFGYNRDKIKGKRQILLGLVLTNHIPIAHFVFPGNVADKKTIDQTLSYLRLKFGIKNITFVADRGTVTDYNLELIEANGYNYIVSTDRRKNSLIKKLMLMKIKEKAKEVYCEKNKRRYILCFNEEMKTQKNEEIELLIKEFKETFDRNKTIALRRREKIPLLKRLFDDEGNLKNEVYEYEKAIAGRFLLLTNTDFDPEVCYQIYKELTTIEQSFREIKSFLKIRPIYHQQERRIKAHIFVCVIAYLLESLLKKKLINLSISFKTAIKSLEDIKIAFLKYKEVQTKVISELTQQQKEILKCLDIPFPEAIMV